MKQLSTVNTRNLRQLLLGACYKVVASFYIHLIAVVEPVLNDVYELASQKFCLLHHVTVDDIRDTNFYYVFMELLNLVSEVLDQLVKCDNRIKPLSV